MVSYVNWILFKCMIMSTKDFWYFASEYGFWPLIDNMGEVAHLKSKLFYSNKCIIVKVFHDFRVEAMLSPIPLFISHCCIGI